MPAGENGKLFGSVNNTNVAVELEKRGFTIEKKRIEIPEHTIRSVGTFKIRIRLYDKEEATIKLIVEGAPQPGASSAQAKQRAPRARKAEEAPAAPEAAAAAKTPAPETPAPSAEA